MTQRRKEEKSNWPGVLLVVLCLAGLGVALDLTLIHIHVHTNPNYHSFCALSEKVNCETVAESSYSIFLGVPVSVWGLVGYLLMLIVTLILLRKERSQETWGAMVALSLFAVGTSAILGTISALLIHSLCIMCLSSYVINLLLFFFTLVGVARYKAGLWKSLSAFLRWGWRYLRFSFVLLFGVVVLILAYPPYWKKSLSLNKPGKPVPRENPVYGKGVTAEGHHWIGARSPKITILEFSDYQCPFCRRAHFMMRKITRENRDIIRLVHRHYPLDQHCNPQINRPFHPAACRLARQAWCAGQQHHFWAFNDLFYRFRGQISPSKIHRFAEMWGLDLETFRRCESSPQAKAAVERDLQEAIQLALPGTPCFFVNGRRFVGPVPSKYMKKLIEKVRRGPEGKRPARRPPVSSRPLPRTSSQPTPPTKSGPRRRKPTKSGPRPTKRSSPQGSSPAQGTPSPRRGASARRPALPPSQQRPHSRSPLRASFEPPPTSKGSTPQRHQPQEPQARNRPETPPTSRRSTSRPVTPRP